MCSRVITRQEYLFDAVLEDLSSTSIFAPRCKMEIYTWGKPEMGTVLLQTT